MGAGRGVVCIWVLTYTKQSNFRPPNSPDLNTKRNTKIPGDGAVGHHVGAVRPGGLHAGAGGGGAGGAGVCVIVIVCRCTYVHVCIHELVGGDRCIVLGRSGLRDSQVCEWVGV